MDYGFVEESKKSEIIKSGGGSLLRVKSEYLTLKQCLPDNTVKPNVYTRHRCIVIREIQIQN